MTIAADFPRILPMRADRRGAALPGRRTRIRAEQTNVVFRGAPIGTSGAMLGGILLSVVVLIVDRRMMPVVVPWLAVLTTVFAAHLVLCRFYARAADAVARWRLWAGWFVVASLAEGCVWGFGAIALIANGNLDRELAVMLVVSAVAACSAAAFGPFFPAFLAFMVPAMLPYLGWTLLQHNALHYALAGLDAVFIAGVAAIGWRANNAFEETLNLRFEVTELVEDLRAQKSRAEEASVAKSRFLAAASHDLRQPVHALSMFVGALQRCAMDDEARRIAGHIGRSIDAIDGLFSALLDISKLDAGVVEMRPRIFAIQPLLQRLRADHAATAREQDIELRVVTCSLEVETDPIFLERILRNIVVNALRFTRSGRVLIGCRRGARRLQIAVYDTGPGIPAEETARIFEEFYQLDNPERDRQKGLGLGLAIVNRLSNLLACPVSVRSTPGRGSMFSVSVPLGRTQERIAVAEKPAIRPLAGAGVVLVVEDEAMIRDAMTALLSGWGFAPLVAGSLAEMLVLIEACFDVPKLIISDLRLRDGENGIAAITELQAQYNDGIPGLLITGDTAPERIHESASSGFTLLHKPIAPDRLRATIDDILEKAERGMLTTPATGIGLS